MKLKIPHKFTKEQAIARVKTALNEAKPKLEEAKVTIEEERWEGDTLHFAFTAQGQAISGQVTVEDAQFDVYARLPLMMKLFEGRIEKAIAEQAKSMLG